MGIFKRLSDRQFEFAVNPAAGADRHQPLAFLRLL